MRVIEAALQDGSFERCDPSLHKQLSEAWKNYREEHENYSISPGASRENIPEFARGNTINFIIKNLFTNNITDTRGNVVVNQAHHGSSSHQGSGQPQEDLQAQLQALAQALSQTLAQAHAHTQALAQAQAQVNVQAQAQAQVNIQAQAQLNAQAQFDKDTLLELINSKWSIQKKVLYSNIMKFFEFSENGFPCLDYVWLNDAKRLKQFNARTQTDYSLNLRMNEAVVSMCNTWLKNNDSARLSLYLASRWNTYQNCYVNPQSSVQTAQYTVFDGEQALRTQVNLPLSLDSASIYLYPARRNQQANQVAVIGQPGQLTPNLARLQNVIPTHILNGWFTVQNMQTNINSEHNTACHSVSAFDIKILLQRVDLYQEKFGVLLPGFDVEDHQILSTTKTYFKQIFAGGVAEWNDNDEYLKTYKLFNHVDKTYEEYESVYGSRSDSDSRGNGDSPARNLNSSNDSHLGRNSSNTDKEVSPHAISNSRISRSRSVTPTSKRQTAQDAFCTTAI